MRSLSSTISHAPRSKTIKTIKAAAVASSSIKEIMFKTQVRRHVRIRIRVARIFLTLCRQSRLIFLSTVLESLTLQRHLQIEFCRIACSLAELLCHVHY